MRYVAVVSFHPDDSPASLNVLDQPTAVTHVQTLMERGMTVFSKPFDVYGSALVWANGHYHNDKA